jgi:hypothetical protein
MAIVRSEAEILECQGRARKLTDKAEEQGLSDQPADAIYEFTRWLLGHDDTHPSEGYLEDDEDKG